MLSSISVAVMTRLPSMRHLVMSFFWICGSSSKGISTPMSPRPIMMPSQASQICSILSTPERFSSLAMTSMSLAPSSSSQACTASEILAAGDEGTGDEVHVVFHAEADVLLVLLAEVGLLEHLAGEAHALAVGQFAAGHDLAADLRIGTLEHPEDHQAVVDQHRVADFQFLGEVLVGDGDALAVAEDVFGGKGEMLALVEHDAAVREAAGAVFGALGVQHDGDGHVQLLAHALDELDLFQMFLVRAVGEVEPRHVHARHTHLGKRIFIVTGRADGADDLCFSHS